MRTFGNTVRIQMRLTALLASLTSRAFRVETKCSNNGKHSSEQTRNERLLKITAPWIMTREKKASQYECVLGWQPHLQREFGISNNLMTEVRRNSKQGFRKENQPEAAACWILLPVKEKPQQSGQIKKMIGCNIIKMTTAAVCWLFFLLLVSIYANWVHCGWHDDTLLRPSHAKPIFIPSEKCFTCNNIYNLMPCQLCLHTDFFRAIQRKKRVRKQNDHRTADRDVVWISPG